MKIEKTIRLRDRQRIHVIGPIYPRELHEYMSAYNSDAYVYEWDYQQQAHYAMRRFIRDNYPELSQWLTVNNCQTTNWVDPDIFEVLPNTQMNFSWGIGFKPDDPVETIFVLRWS